MDSHDPEANTILAKAEASGTEDAVEVSAATFDAMGETDVPGPRHKRKRKSYRKLPRGSMLGRYVILDQLGVGGMGVVYGAYDPELDRRVAIKLLQTDADAPENGTAGHARLLREAQAMARLTHPNVIAVYDVGSIDDAVFVAMEFVQGITLTAQMKAWWTPGPADRREVLSRFIAAGRGLAAAHAAGVVHRDFKPDNVMVAGDGRVLVLDFGLARPTGEDRPASLDSDEVDIDVQSFSSSHLSANLTKTGTVMGTPAYMSPEQMTGKGSTDAATDQFSFCVALYEALYNERPFGGKSFAELSGAVLREQIRDPPRGSRVPQWLRRAILRGLAKLPENRYPSMNALLDALQRDPARRRRTIALSVAGVLLLGGAAAVGATVGKREDPCRDAGSTMDEVWNDTRRDEVQAAFDAVGKAYIADVLQGLIPDLDAYAQGWSEQAREACVAAKVRGEQSDDVFGLRTSCLERRRIRFDAFVQTLAEADASVVTQAITAVDALPALETCANVEMLQSGARPPDDPAVYRQVEELRLELERVEALMMTARFDAAIEFLEELLVRAEAVGYAPLVAEVQVNLADVEGNLGHSDRVLELSRAALLTAEAQGYDSLIVSSLLQLCEVEGLQRNRFERASEFADRAEAVIFRMGNSIDDRIRLYTIRGNMAKASGDWDGAVKHLEAALALYEEQHTEDEPRMFTPLTSLGAAYVWLERLDEADKVIQRALVVAQRDLGPGHPNVGVVLTMLARLRLAQNQTSEGIELLEQARAIFVAGLGANHSNVASIDNGLGLAYDSAGDLQAALKAYQSALAVTTAARGTEAHLDVAAVHNNLGNLHRDLGQTDLAIEHHSKSQSIKLELLGAENADIAFGHDNLGDDHLAAGDLALAEPEFLASIALFEKIASKDDRRLSYPLSGLGMVYLAQGSPERALPLLERALAIDEATQQSDEDVARVAFPLAKALWATGDRTRARALAERARRGRAVHATANAKIIAEIDAWLAAHPP